MEEKDSLAVYYGKNFWTASQGAPAQAVPVDWQFTWAGHLCRIPALYVSDAGLTLDVLLFLDGGAVRTFCKKMCIRDRCAAGFQRWKARARGCG